jgi:hypothetical protein
MPSSEYAATRSDPRNIGRGIKEVIRLTLEEGVSWQAAADRTGIARARVARAMTKPHVRAYRLEKRRELIESLSGRVPLRLSQLMDGENEAACVRACLAMEDLRNEAMAEPSTRRAIAAGGITIVIGTRAAERAQRLLPQVAPALELIPDKERIGD